MAISLIPLIAEYLGKNARLKNLEEEPYSANEQRVANNPSQSQNNFINSYQLQNSNSLQPFYAGYQPSTTSSQDLNNNPTAPSTESELISSNSISISTPTDLALDAQMMILGMPDDGSAPLVQSQSAKLPTEYLVQFNAGVSLDDRNTALARLNATILEIVHPADSNSGDLVLVRVPPGASPDVLSALGNAPGVKFAEPNWSIGVQAFSNDTYYSNGSLWGMYGDTTSPSNTYGSQAGEAWAAGFTGTSKTVVGVIDTGIDYTHPDLYLNIWLNQGELPTGMALRDVDLDGLITFRDLNNSINSSFVSDLNNNGRIDAGDILNDARWENGSDQDSNGFIDDLVGWDFVNRDNDPYDDQSHGTHVAGTIGAMGGNGTGVAGVTWNVQMMGLKFLSATGSGSTAGAIQAIDYYTSASAIDQSSGWSSEFIGTNNSWGGGGFSQSLLDSIIRGAYQDALFIAAAGNSGTNNDSVANYPSNYSTLAAVGFESVIAVAATTNSGGLASYSNFGASTVDLGAPGSSIWWTVPGGGYASYSGTSMATPHVTGALALYASQNLSATSAQLRSQLLSNTTTLASLAGKTVTGGTLDVGKMMSGGTPPTDTIAPLLSSATPADNSTNVAVGANLVMTFNETVRAGSGNIQIFNSNGTIARTIAVTDTSQVTFSGNTVTINPTADLAPGAAYYVNMASGVIRDTAGNNFAGISNTTAWNFTTIVGDISAPLLSSATPADNSTNVAVGANLVMTFNETVRAGSGNIQIFNSNGTIARTIAVTDTSQVTFSGNTVTINPTADLAPGTAYYVNMASGVIRDTAGNNFAGISNTTAWNFTTIVGDISAPLLSSATPADNSTNVAVGANLVMTFNETVRAGSGNIQIFNSNGTIARTIAVTDTSQVTFSGNTVTINPTADLAPGAAYYVNMASGVIRDTAGNNFAGISNTTAWNFTTIVGDISAPLLSSATPADNSTNVAVGANLVMTFNETVRAGSGNIQIFNSNGTIARTIAVTDTSQVTFSGNTVTINPTADLAPGAAYYVNMASGVIRDTAGNNFAGISNTTAWNFTTIVGDISAPLLSSATPADNSTNVAVGANLVMTFNETVRAGSGNIQIFNSNGTIARTIAVTDTSQVTFSGNTVTINPTADLARGAGYYVNMASGVIRDTAGNNFAGISNTTAWNFTTIVGDISAPLLSSATPADNSTNVAVGANLVMTFNETVRAGSGNIQIFNSNGTIARTIAVTDTSQVTFSGNTVTINPTADLARGAGYYVNMASGVIRDTAGNNFAGISNPTAWNFMTAAPQDYAGNTLTTAYNIGALTGSRTFSDFVGTNDTNDYYRFTLNSRSNFSLSLTGMSADADVHILNASGSVIASSTAASANNESISKTLDAGNYYVRVYQYSGDTNYTLTLNQQNVAAPANGLARYGTDSSDVIVGTSFADLLSGAPIAGGLMGRGSIDRLTGGLGNDLFILGDARGRFYDDQNLSNAGMGDYALITDFQVSGDRLQLSSGNYFLAATTINGASGTGIYFDSNSNRSFGTNDELLGVLQGVSASALSSNNFTWI